MEIELFKKVGRFAENKDTAKEIRVSQIVPILRKGKSVILDFKGVESATQSFIHALISEVIREFSIDVLNENLKFRNCDETIKKIIALNEKNNYVRKGIGVDSGGLGSPILDFLLLESKLKYKIVGLDNA